jgi:HD-like signal output (HDOD) protein
MDQTGELPTLPAVAHRILKLVRDEHADSRMLADVIRLDPLIAARLLRLANSAYYRPAGIDSIADVHRAVVYMGFATIRNVVLVTCLRSLYSPTFRTNHFSAGDLWVHSVLVAVASRLIASERAPQFVEEAFTAGLVHDVGMIVEWNLFSDLFPQVLARYQGTGRHFIDVEQEVLGFDHTMAGAAILRRWAVPKPIRNAAGFHHRTEPPADEYNLSAIVHAAELVAAARGDGFFDMLGDETAAQAALCALGLQEDALANLLPKAEAELEEARSILDL